MTITVLDHALGAEDPLTRFAQYMTVLLLVLAVVIAVFLVAMLLLDRFDPPDREKGDR